LLDGWGQHEDCHLTMVGRVAGAPHTIEIWFAAHDGSAWLFTEPEGRTDWVRNVPRAPGVRLEVGEVEVSAHDVGPGGGEGRRAPSGSLSRVGHGPSVSIALRGHHVYGVKQAERNDSFVDAARSWSGGG
jgi:hypothetical protein